MAKLLIIILGFTLCLYVSFTGWVKAIAAFHEQDRQVMAGQWSVDIQLQPCDPGQLKTIQHGDVLTVVCKTYAVKAR